MIVIFCPKAFLCNAAESAVTNGAGLISGNGVQGFGSTGNPLAAIVTNPDLNLNVSRLRIVSAELDLYSVQAPTAISGRCLSALLPGSWEITTALTSVNNFATASTLPNAKTSHLIEGARALYLPGGPEDLLYSPCSDEYAPVTQALLASGGFAGWSDVATATRADSGGPVLVCAVGSAVDAAPLYGRAIVNYQYVPESTNAFAQIEPVPHDQGAMDGANFLASFPRVLQGYFSARAETVAAGISSLAGYANSFANSPIGRNVIGYAASYVRSQFPGTRPGGMYGQGSRRLELLP
jgi:hypothetical protein